MEYGQCWRTHLVRRKIKSMSTGEIVKNCTAMADNCGSCDFTVLIVRTTAQTETVVE
jgi:hypothetical protein